MCTTFLYALFFFRSSVFGTGSSYVVRFGDRGGGPLAQQLRLSFHSF
jgi:hypothetical protein